VTDRYYCPHCDHSGAVPFVAHEPQCCRRCGQPVCGELSELRIEVEVAVDALTFFASHFERAIGLLRPEQRAILGLRARAACIRAWSAGTCCSSTSTCRGSR
jgi:hypothetical protein